MSSENVIHRLKQETPDNPQYMFWCPGCKHCHWFKTTGGAPKWTFNGDMVKPTVMDSIRTYENRKGADDKYVEVTLCHSFVEDGQIRFLDDCLHDLKGQTVPLKPF